MIREIYFIFAALIMVGCSNNNYDATCLNMFHPDTNIQITDIIRMGGDRVMGIDIDMYEFKRDDTLITVSFNMDSNSTLLGFDWLVPIPDTIHDTAFLNELSMRYSVTFNPEKKLAYCHKSRLIFMYYVGENEDENEMKSRRCFLLKYEPWLLMF